MNDLNYTGSSYFPASKFTKSNIHFDWMVGVEKFNGFVDYLTGEKIKKFTTILWNKTMRATITLDNYYKLKDSPDHLIQEKLSKLILPTDLKVS